MRLFSRLFTAIFVASLVLPAAIAGPALADSTTHLTITTPGSQTAGVAFMVTVSALDVSETPDPTYTGTIHFTSSDGSAILPVDDSGLGGAGGTNTYAITLHAAGSQTVTVTDDEGNGPVGTGSISVDPGPADASTTTITASTPVTTDNSSTITVQLRDASGNDLAASDGVVTLATTHGSITGLTDNTDGTWTASLSDTTVDTAHVTGKLDGADIAQSANVTFTPGAAEHLTFTTHPGDGTGGLPLSIQPVVEVRDAGDNLVPGVRDITVAIGTNAGGGTLSGTKVVATSSDGIATFTNLAIDAPGTGYTLTATATGGITLATSDPFNVTTGDPDHLVFTTSPSGVTGGSVFGTQPIVEVRDAGDNLVPGIRGITVTIGTNPSGGALSGTTTLNTNSSGIATFGDLQIDKVGNGYTLTASAAGPVTGTSSTFNVTTGAADHLVFTTTPAGTGGTVFSPQPAVQVEDAGNNPVSGVRTIVLTIGTNPFGGTLGGTVSLATNGSGLATFTNTKIDKAGVGYTLTATSGLLTGSSTAFDVTVGPATHLVFATQPVGATGGATLATQPVVEVRDAGENLVPGVQAMTIAFGTNAGPGTLGGTLTINTSAGGGGTFTDLSVDKAAAGYTLTASIAGPLSATSAAFTISVGAAHHLAFTAGSPTGTGGVVFTTQPAVAVEDAGNNIVPAAGTSITIAIDPLNSPPGGTLSGGPLTVNTDGTGVATFGGLSIDKANTAYHLIASAPGLAVDRSGPIDISVGPAHHLVFAPGPTQALQDVAIAPAIAVDIVDAGGNVVTSDTSQVTLAFGSNPGGGVLAGNLSQFAVSGVATFPDISIHLIGNAYTLTATDGLLPVLTSDPFNINLFPNRAPAGTDNAITTAEDTAYQFSPADFGFSDPSDTPANTLQAITIATLPTAGTLQDNGATVVSGLSIPLGDITGGHLVFTPAANANGASYASFTFQVQDTGGTASGGVDLDPTPNTITINVTPVNDAPVAVADGAVVKQGQSLTTTFATGVLPNDSDVETPASGLTAVLDSSPAHGTLAFNANGSYTYTPTPSYLGPDSFTYHAFDGAAPSNTVTVSITVYINHPPIAASDIVTVISGSRATVLDVLANDYAINPDAGEVLRITAVGHPVHGTAVIAHADAAVSYRPSSTFSGTDIFTYTVSDGQFSTSTSVLVHVPKDKVRPTTTAPVQTIAAQKIGSKTVVVRLAWTGTDVGSGVASYQLQQKTGSHGYATVKLSKSTSRSSSRTLSVGSTYRFRVRAVDKRGNVGAWAYGPTFKVVRLQENSASYVGSWAKRSSSSYSGGKERSTSVTGASASITTTGRTISWFGIRAKSRGTAQVFVDGVLAQTVNLALSTTRYQYIVFSRTFATSASRTIQIVFTGAPTKMIDIDGFIVLR